MHRHLRRGDLWSHRKLRCLCLLLTASIGCFLGMQGCALRPLTKTPSGMLRYPYVPVDPQEVAGFKKIIRETPGSPEVPRARFWIAQAEFNRQEWAAAEQQFFGVLQKHPASEWAPVAALMGARCRVEQGKNLPALTGLGQLLKTYPQNQDLATASQELAGKIINDNLTLEELARVRASFPGSAWDEQALFVSGKRTLDQGDPANAIKLFEQFLSLFPASSFGDMARGLKDKAMQIVPVNRLRIGCLVPLSGSFAFYGKAVFEGVQLALEQLNLKLNPNEQLSLAVADCQGTTDGAVAAFIDLAEREKVMAVIGPVLSNSAKALLPFLAGHHLCMITPSAAEPGLTAGSSYMFRYMLTNQEQGAAMAEYVVLRRNLQRIGILSSDDPYDRSLADAFSAKVLDLGGEIVARAEYKRGVMDFKEQMLALGGVEPGKIKNIDVQARKSMENIAETAAVQFHRQLVPAELIPEVPDPKAPPLPQKKLAIIRLTETGDLVQAESLGKAFTEKISYAMARKPGLKVMTQTQTFKSLRQLNLPTMTLSTADLRRIGKSLDVDYVVRGEIKQLAEPQGNTQAESLPVPCQVNLELVRVDTGEVLHTVTRGWVKEIPPLRNQKGLEAVYLPVPGRDAILLASQLAFYDLKAEIFGCDAWLSPQFLRQAEAELDGAVFTTGFWAQDSSPENQDFIQSFEMKYQATPTLLSAQAYDTMMLVARVLQSIKMPNARRESFREELGRIRNFRGLTGLVMVEPDGEIKQEAIFLQLNKGNLKRVR